MAKGSVTLPGHFAPGTKVKIHERVSDGPDRDTIDKPVKTATVTKDAEVKVKGLDADRAYWVTGDVEGVGSKSVRVVAKHDSPQAETATRRLRDAGGKPAGKPARRVDKPPPGPKVVHGARSSASSRATQKGRGGDR